METNFWSDKTILITGHTGFKGGWLSLWLKQLGAKVIGYSLPPATQPNLFELANIEEGMVSIFGDLSERDNLVTIINKYKPDIVFHLAAQALVCDSYETPVETFTTNILGTAHVLDAIYKTDSVRVCQIITSDKCYENDDAGHAYKEEDRLGGHDPYSSSKACAELVTASYQKSFFAKKDSTSISTLRAGNIIGGGDWAKNRLIPDCIRALSKSKSITVRNPKFIRPWQYVLEPISGYLYLTEKQWQDPCTYAGPWNFGPLNTDEITVEIMVKRIIDIWGSGSWDIIDKKEKQFYESRKLKLDITKATKLLNWRPVYSSLQSIEHTINWYKSSLHNTSVEFIRGLCIREINDYVDATLNLGLPWSKSMYPKKNNINAREMQIL